MKISYSKIKIATLSVLLVLGSTSAQAATTKVISEAQNATTISVKSGTLVTIALHSTYWDGAKVQNLVQIKPSEISPTPATPTAADGCQHPGSGCGTIKWFYKAKKKGFATFTASRTTCGEAMQCTSENSNFKVKFLVK